MGQEIRKETDWLGNEKDVIYENGTKVGETRWGTTLFGDTKGVTYDTSGNKVSETLRDTTWLGESREITRSNSGEVSQTIYEQGLFEKKGVIYENGIRIGELRTEKGFFGGRKQVLNESGEEVDLTRRATKEDSASTSGYSGYSGGYSSGGYSVSQPKKSASMKMKGFVGILSAMIIGSIICFSPKEKPSVINDNLNLETYNSTEEYRKKDFFEEYKVYGKEDLFNQLNQIEHNVLEMNRKNLNLLKESESIRSSGLENMMEESKPADSLEDKSVENKSNGDVDKFCINDGGLYDEMSINAFLSSSIKGVFITRIGEGGLAVDLGRGIYYKIESSDFDELKSIGEKYNRLFVMSLGKNRYRSNLEFQNCLINNREMELRKTIVEYPKIKVDEFAFFNYEE